MKELIIVAKRDSAQRGKVICLRSHSREQSWVMNPKAEANLHANLPLS